MIPPRARVVPGIEPLVLPAHVLDLPVRLMQDEVRHGAVLLKEPRGPHVDIAPETAQTVKTLADNARRFGNRWFSTHRARDRLEIRAFELRRGTLSNESLSARPTGIRSAAARAATICSPRE